jgi:hypothetical protein
MNYIWSILLHCTVDIVIKNVFSLKTIGDFSKDYYCHVKDELFYDKSRIGGL